MRREAREGGGEADGEKEVVRTGLQRGRGEVDDVQRGRGASLLRSGMPLRRAGRKELELGRGRKR